MDIYLQRIGVLVLVATILVGCTPKEYAQQASRETYQVLAQKLTLALGQPNDFTIDHQDFEHEHPLPDTGETPLVLSLAQCRGIAFKNSRELRRAKETLFAAALDLDNARHKWSVPSGFAVADVSHSATSRGDETNSATGELELSFLQRFAQGGLLTLGVSLDLASELMGIDSTTLGSLLEANFTQPLLRGAWRNLAYEDLYRQERDVAISVLAYERFRQTFSTQVTTQYYQVLQQLDQLNNEQANIVRLDKALRRTRVQVEGGQVSRIEQDQTEQNLLDAKVRFASNLQRYRNGLDDFKLTLSMPIQTEIELDPDELQRLNEQGPAAIPFLDEAALNQVIRDVAAQTEKNLQERAPGPDASEAERRAWARTRQQVITRRTAKAYESARRDGLLDAQAKAIDVALHARTDVLVSIAHVRDAHRDVQIAADQFNPQLDIILGLSAASTDPRDFERIQFHRHTRLAALALDYDLDQTDNRDAYRLALIAEDQSRRNFVQFLDDVRFQVRQTYRQLLQARRTYELQKQNVAVARRRQVLASLEQAAGEASARDVVEADEGLRSAQNGLAGAMVGYETTRIGLLATLGLIDVDDRGQPHERTDPFLFKRLSKLYGNVEDFPY